MIKVKAIRSDGQVFVYQNNQYGINGLGGVDFPEVELFTQKRGNDDGSILLGKRLSDREIEIKVTGKNRLNSRIDRKQFVTFHNPLLRFKIEVEYLGTKRETKWCELQVAHAPTGNINNYFKGDVIFLSTDALLYETISKTRKLANLRGLWHFPIVFNRPLAFDVKKPSAKETFEYDGIKSSPLKVDISFSGYVQNITVKLSRGDGRKINFKITNEFKSKDNLIIDVADKTIWFNHEILPVEKYLENIFDFESLFLTFGVNDIEVVSDDPGNKAFEATVTYIGAHGGL